MDIPNTRNVELHTDETLGPDTPIFIACTVSTGETVRLVFEQDLASGFVNRLSALLAEIKTRPRPS